MDFTRRPLVQAACSEDMIAAVRSSEAHSLMRVVTEGLRTDDTDVGLYAVPYTMSQELLHQL
jgi:hypothetical protein